MKLELKNIKKNVLFNNQQISILKDVSMTCQSGQIVVIVGESGSGKSTLLNIMSTLDDATAGEYLWKGNNIFSFSKKKQESFLANNIGIVFQQYNLINDMPADDNVKIALYVNSEVKKRDRDKKVDEVLDKVGLYDRKKHLPNTLSGGEQQRVAIARAIINNPDIVFADEPTGNVDRDNEEHILNIIREIANQGKIVVIVTHSEVVKTFADKVYRLSDGRLIEETRSEEKLR
ncbi:MAG TPA: ABC transporter ATP-binding protein [Clostridiales bacterium]|nr:ABC transporter ATP-binding protein [Clostridiales bacterium]